MSGQLKNDIGERKLRVTLLSAEWKASSDGDLTTINRELAIQMAKHPNVEVSVFLPWCSEEDKKDADNYNVKLIKAVKLPGLKPVLWLASVPDGHAMDCVVGHGVALGQQIPLIKNNPNYTHCKWIQVVHTAPEEIGMYKNISEGQQMQQTEIELCEMADQVVTIGLKLTEAYKNQLGKKDVFNLTPSILSEFSDVQQASDERRTFCALVIESGDSEDFDVKGYKIAAKAIANLKDKSYQLKFASKQSGKEDELKHKLLQCGIDHNQLIICSFDENRKTLANLFSMVDIVLLPSKTEGFGLSALKAISAGLPVLVSGNSGIAEALREVPNGSQFIVDSEDPADWARAIKVVRNKKRNVRLREAKILRGNYLQQFSWEEHCDFLVTKMCNLAFEEQQKAWFLLYLLFSLVTQRTLSGNRGRRVVRPNNNCKEEYSGEMNIKVDVDDLEPERQNMQTGMLATESVRCQEVQQPGASATSAASGSVSYSQTEDLHALKVKTFLSIIKDSFHSTKPQSIEECNQFKEYAKEMKVIIVGVSDGSLVITVKCESLMILENLWTDYSSGRLGEVVQNCFVTEKILKELNLAELRLKTTMDIEEYNACKMFFEKDAHRDALSSEFHSTSSTSESPQKKEQCEKSEPKTKVMEKAKLEDLILGASSSEFHSISSTSESPQNQEELKKQKQKTKIVETEKLKGTSPLTVIPTTGHGKELIGKAQGGKGMLPLLGSSTSDSEESEVESFTSDSEPEDLLRKLQIMKGASSSEFHSISSTSGSPQIQEELKKWKQKTKIGETEKLKGMLPLHGSYTSDPEEELEELGMTLQIMKGSSSPPLLSTTDLEEKLERVCVNLKMLRVEGGFSVLQFSTIDLEKKLAELIMKLQRLRMEGTLSPPELFIADLEDDLERLREKLNRLRMTGSSHPLVSTIEVELGELLKQLQKWSKEGMLPLPGSSTFDLEEEPEELHKKLEIIIMEGSFPVLKFSTIYLEETLAELSDQLHRLRMEGTFLPPALLTADLEEKLKKLLTALERQRDKGSLPSTFSTIEVEVDELLKKFQKWRIEGALSSEFHSTSSTSESPLTKEQWEKSEQQTKIMETAKLEGTSPLIVVPTTGHGKELEERWGRKGMLPLPGSFTFDLEEKLEKLYMKLLTIKGSSSLPVADLKEKLDQVFEEIRMLRMEGGFSEFSTIDLKKKLAELRMELQRLRMEGTLPPPELFTADLEDELERLIELLMLEPREGMKGSSIFDTIGTVFRLRHELKKVKMEALENAMNPTIRSGLAKFDVSLPEERQNYVSYLLDESAKLPLRKQVLQPPRALEELREAMDKDELKTFLTIHIREGAWQVVLLFTDELPRVKLPRDWYSIIHNEDEDEDEDEEVSNEVIYCSKSGILNGWPTHYDPGLVTLCKAITNKDWKVTRLILSLSRIRDEGLKNLSTALTQSELYSLTLYDIGLQRQGLEHLCNALTSVNCRLTNLNVRGNKLGDVGIMHLCNALTSVDCTLTSLNVSNSELGDNGLKHLCDALTSSNCALTKLKVRFNRLGDRGIKELSDVLTSGFCTLTSLDVSGNKFGDEGIKHLCKALTDTKCKLRSLDSSANWNVTDDGKKYLSQMLTGTDWEDKGALRLSRSTTK